MLNYSVHAFMLPGLVQFARAHGLALHETPPGPFKTRGTYAAFGLIDGVTFSISYKPMVHRHQKNRTQVDPAHVVCRARLHVPLDFHIPAITNEHFRRQEAIWTPLFWREYHRLSEHCAPFVDAQGIELVGIHEEPLGLDLFALPRHMVPMIHEVERVRPTIPCASDFEPHLAAWARCAERHGLVLTQAPLGVHGRLGGYDMWCWVRRDANNRPEVVLKMLYQAPLEVGLDVDLMTRKDRIFVTFGGQDIETGDPAFDKRFRVRGHDEEAVKRGLDETTRSHITALADLHALEIDDEGISMTLDEGLEGLAHIDALIEHGRGAMEALQRMRKR